MHVLLGASVLFLVAGVALLLLGRRRAVADLERRRSRSRAASWLTSAGVALAATGALLLVAFVAIASTMAPSGAATG